MKINNENLTTNIEQTKPNQYWLHKKFSEEHKQKIKNALKGKMPKNINRIKGWNKGLFGFNKGHFVSLEARKKISLAHLGKPKTKEHIEKILSDAQGNISEAARRLGIARPTLRRKIQKYHLKSSE